MDVGVGFWEGLLGARRWERYGNGKQRITPRAFLVRDVYLPFCFSWKRSLTLLGQQREEC